MDMLPVYILFLSLLLWYDVGDGIELEAAWYSLSFSWRFQTLQQWLVASLCFTAFSALWKVFTFSFFFFFSFSFIFTLRSAQIASPQNDKFFSSY